MGMAELLLVLVLGLVGPLLATPRRFAIPVAVGEILAGAVFGVSGLRVLDVSKPNLALLSQIGFALVMMVTASHIDVCKIFAGKAIGRASTNVLFISAAAAVAAFGIQALTGLQSLTWTFWLILMSSSAAVVLPSFVGTKAPASLAIFVAQVTLADLAAIVLLPLVANASNPGRVVLGAGVVTASSVLVYWLLRLAQRSGAWKRARKFSADHGFGLELRLSLILLLTLVLFAQSFAVSIMIAGFGLGLAIGANGVPKRLARQVFAVSEGLFSPIFFVLLGAGIDVTAVVRDPGLLILAGALGLGNSGASGASFARTRPTSGRCLIRPARSSGSGCEHRNVFASAYLGPSGGRHAGCINDSGGHRNRGSRQAS